MAKIPKTESYDLFTTTVEQNTQDLLQVLLLAYQAKDADGMSALDRLYNNVSDTGVAQEAISDFVNWSRQWLSDRQPISLGNGVGGPVILFHDFAGQMLNMPGNMEISIAPMPEQEEEVAEQYFHL